MFRLLEKSRIALLNTGDELVNGDVVNSNGPFIARVLTENGMQIGQHMVVSDEEDDIIQGIQFLSKHHDVLIITGGLGPTSDDRTRFALAHALGRDLFFDEPSWQAILDRLSKYRVTVHDSNKRQCMFPKGAQVIPNANGTAAGCFIESNSKLIAMLPGPPRECLPMFNQFVLPKLKSAMPQSEIKHFKWRLFGVSEGEMAAKLDALVSQFPNVHTGYRWDYPYLEFKLHTHSQKQIDQLLDVVEKAIAPHQISSAEKTASEQLRTSIAQSQQPVVIHDQATGGLLQSLLITPETRNTIQFSDSPLNITDPNIVLVEVSGLNEYWNQKQPPLETHLHITIRFHDQIWQSEQSIRYLNSMVCRYAVEYICYKIQSVL